MVVSFKVFLDQRRKKHDNTYPVKLRANIDGKLKEVSLDLAVEEKFWDKKNQRVRPSYPNAQATNLRLTQTLNEYQEKVLRLQNQHKHFTPIDLFEERNRNNRTSFQDFAEIEIQKLIKAGRVGNALSYRSQQGN